MSTRFLLVIAAAMIGGIYYLQENPEIGSKIKQAFSKESLFDVKFSNQKGEKQYQGQNDSLFFPNQNNQHLETKNF